MYCGKISIQISAAIIKSYCWLHCMLWIPSIRFYWLALTLRYTIGRRSVASKRSCGLVGHRRHRVVVYTAPAYTIHAMAAEHGDFDTDLAAAPAKRMRYSFADEIAQSSHFEAFGQRFTGFPSGDCYGKCKKKRSETYFRSTTVP